MSMMLLENPVLENFNVTEIIVYNLSRYTDFEKKRISTYITEFNYNF